jgi:hypothetical protein
VASPDKKHFILRIDPAVWAEVESLAAQELRSANAQAEMLLREALARRGRTVDARGARAGAEKPARTSGDDGR